MRFLVVLAALLCAAPALAQPVYLTAPPVGYAAAVCDGTTDDTAAIQALLSNFDDLSGPAFKPCAVSNLYMQHATRFSGYLLQIPTATGCVLTTGQNDYVIHARASGGTTPDQTQAPTSTADRDGFCLATQVNGDAVVYADNFTNRGIMMQPEAKFTASISGTTMTVTQMFNGTLAPGQNFIGDNTGPGYTQIVSQLSGTPGGVGSYSVTPSRTAASGNATVADNELGPHAIVHGCHSYNNFVGLDTNDGHGSEYLVISDCDFSHDRTSYWDRAGNVTASNLKFSGSYDCVYIDGTTYGNPDHGNLGGSLINHCQHDAIHTNGVQIGFNFVGNQIHSGIIYLQNSTNVQISHGVLDLPEIDLDGGGVNRLQDNAVYPGFATVMNHNFNGHPDQTIVEGQFGSGAYLIPNSYGGNAVSGAWNTYAPSVTCDGAGSLGSYTVNFAGYRQDPSDANAFDLLLDIAVPSIGTCASAIDVSLPPAVGTIAHQQTVQGKDRGTGPHIDGIAAGNIIWFTNYNNTMPGNGAHITLAGKVYNN